MIKSLGIALLLATANSQTWETVFDGYKGSWMSQKVADPGFFACGVALRQSFTSSFDKSGTNGLKLAYCNGENWGNQKESLIEEGLWGSWTRFVYCPQGEFINGATVRYQKYNTNDNTAINGLAIICSDPKNLNNDDSEYVVDAGQYGEWRRDHAVHIKGKYVCGGQAKFEPDQGFTGDNTALNGISFKFCSLRFLQKVNFKYEVENLIKTTGQISTQANTYINRLSEPVEYKYTYVQKTTQTDTWTSTSSLTSEKTAGISLSIPYINAGGTVEIKQTQQETWESGKTISIEQTHMDEIPVKVPACQIIRVNMVFAKYSVTVPYVATFTYKDGTTETVHGNWEGSNAGDSKIDPIIVDHNVCDDNPDDPPKPEPAIEEEDVESTETPNHFHTIFLISAAVIVFLLLMVLIIVVYRCFTRNKLRNKLETANEKFMATQNTG